jgi:WD40 repeat protein
VVVLLFAGPAAADDVTYWEHVRPVFRKHCAVCHAAKNLRELDVSGGLALDSYEGTLKGARHPVVLPGKAQESPLLEVLRTADPARRMPKDADPLPATTIELISRWIASGAKEGTRPADAAAPTPTKPTRAARRLDVILPTNATPPAGVVASGPAGKLEIVLPVGPLPPVTAVAFSPDGKLLASGAYGRVVVWDAATGQPVKVLTNVLGAVNDLRFSPDGQLLVAAGGQPSFKGDLRLYDTATWQLKATLGGHEDVVFAVAFSPDGRRLASASFDKTVRVWDVVEGKSRVTFTGHSDFVYAVAFSPDGRWLASAGKDRSVKIFDAESGSSRLTLSGMEQDILAVAVSPDGKNVVSSGYEPAVYWWNAQTGERTRQHGGHGVAVHELAFSRDGQWLASAGGDGTVRLWNGSSAALTKTLPAGSVAYAVAFSPDGKRLAAASFDGQVRLWDVAAGRQLASLLSWPDGWLVLTPEGYAVADPATREKARWQTGGQPADAAAVWKALGRAEVIAQALRGEAVPPPKFEK